MKLRAGTWTLLGLATASAIAVRVGPSEGATALDRADEPGAVAFAGAAQHALTEVRIELLRADGSGVVLAPDGAGAHRVLDPASRTLGPADPEAVEGAWDALRLAGVTRTADPGAVQWVGHGRITAAAGAWAVELELGPPTVDGGGRYARSGADATRLSIVEPELAALLELEPAAWLSQRPLPVRATDVTRARWWRPDGGSALEIRRGLDGIFRGGEGGTGAWLGTERVETRLDALFGARMTAWHARGAERGRPWIEVEDRDGRSHRLERLGPCPGLAGHVAVDRGLGWLGCLPLDLVDRFDAVDPARQWFEPRLLPWAYERVLALSQTSPAPAQLRRRGGGWVLSAGEGAREVSEPEVYRLLAALREVEVAPTDEPVPARPPDIDLRVDSDSTERLVVACWRTNVDPIVCRRDDGGALRVIGELPALELDARRFGDARLLAFRAEDVVALEVLVTGGVRQSAHHDLGLWRLDAPAHPEGDAALDEVAFEALIQGLAGLRAEEIVPIPEGSPRRILRVELRARVGSASAVELQLHERCVAVVGARAARLETEACARIERDLLYDDPLRNLLRHGTRVEVEAGGAPVVARRGGEGFTSDDPAAAAALAALEGFRAVALRPDPAPDDAHTRARIHLRAGERVEVELGRDWARVAPGWWYQGR